jgi:hypothetical protein
MSLFSFPIRSGIGSCGHAESAEKRGREDRYWPAGQDRGQPAPVPVRHEKTCWFAMGLLAAYWAARIESKSWFCRAPVDDVTLDGGVWKQKNHNSHGKTLGGISR